MSRVIIIGVIIMLNGCASTTPDNDHIADIIPVSGPFVPVNAVAVRRVADRPLVDGQPSRPRQPNMFTNGSGWRSKPRGYVRLDPPKPPLGNPADPLAKARQMHELNFRWGGLDWVPRRGSDVEFCTAPYGRGPRPKTPLHKQDVSELLKALSETVPRQTFMQKLLWKLGW